MTLMRTSYGFVIVNYIGAVPIYDEKKFLSSCVDSKIGR